MHDWQWSTGLSVPVHWAALARALVGRYPNPYATHVISEDVLQAVVVHVDHALNFDVTQKPGKGQKALYVKKLLTKTNRMPRWGERVLSARHVFVVEESLFVPQASLATVYTRNINLNRFMSLTEQCVYKGGEDGSDVRVEKRVWLSSKCVRGLRSAVCKFGLERYKKNCEKANKGLLWVLQQQASTNKDRDSQEFSKCVSKESDQASGATSMSSATTCSTNTKVPGSVSSPSLVQRLMRLFLFQSAKTD